MSEYFEVEARLQEALEYIKAASKSPLGSGAGGLVACVEAVVAAADGVC